MTSRVLHPVMLLPLAFLVLVFSTRPWTVVPMRGGEGSQAGAPLAGPERSAASAWDEQMPALIARAIPLSELTSTATFARGEGVITAVDTTSRVGTATIEAGDTGRTVQVVMSVGPVIRGDLLRDALGLKFADFRTQVEFATVSTRLNERVLAGLPELAAPLALNGRRIAFVGAARLDEQGVVRLIPIRLTVPP